MRTIRIILIGILAIGLPALLGAQPKMSIVGGLKFNFGEVYTGKSVSRNLTIRNIGTDTLTIADVSASCGCTGTLMSNDNIAPGDSGILSIKFDSRRFSGDIEKTVSMNTNDTSLLHPRITFVAHVIKALSLDPEYIMFKTSVDSSVSETLTLKNISPAPIRILSTTASSEFITSEVSDKEIKPGGSATITCTFLPKQAGTAKGTIVIATDHAKIPSLDVRFFALVTNKNGQNAALGNH